MIDMIEQLKSLREKILSLEERLAETENIAANYEAVAKDWLKEYDKLKEKYEPRILVPSDTPGWSRDKGMQLNECTHTRMHGSTCMECEI